mmetsp:Transcript_2713/g.7233  ORF Transcript_2713/g.7233 Transcript_2713/m.7233 type:complete len:448 (+) Transcript_2713:6860-8203(+)
MAYRIDPRCHSLAERRSYKLLLDMLLDMMSSINEQSSIVSILRYVLACYNYQIEAIVIGDRPYPDEMIPYFGSSYSQVRESPDTPTVKVIEAHFRRNKNTGEMIRNSWKLLPNGYMFINACYTNNPCNDVALLEKLERTIELVCNLCDYMNPGLPSVNFTLMSVGSNAKYCVSEIASRLKAKSIPHNTLHAIQPAAYYRYIKLKSKIGIHKDYTCFSSSGRKFMEHMLQGYPLCANISEADIMSDVSKGLSQLLSSGIKGMLQSNESIANMITASKANQDLEQRLDQVITIQEKNTELMRELLTMLHTNAFVTAVVTDAVIPNAAVSTAATRNVGVLDTLAVPTSAGNLEGTSILGSIGHVDENTSQLSMSVNDIFSPISTKLAPSALKAKDSSSESTQDEAQPKILSFDNLGTLPGPATPNATSTGRRKDMNIFDSTDPFRGMKIS